MRKWWRRAKSAEPVAAAKRDRDRGRYKRLPQRGRLRDTRGGRGRPLPPGVRGPWDEQTEFLPRYGDPFDG